MSDQTSSTRRDFLKSSAAVAAALGSAASTHAKTSGAHSGVDETLRIGLIGCGGRGTGAVLNALAADPHSKLVAVGDTFRDRAEQCLSDLRDNEEFGSRIAVDVDHVFTDFDNYKQVIDACDVVILASPPHFRPRHLGYVVEKGKHAFVEKPVAVDAPGLRHVMESCHLAKEEKTCRLCQASVGGTTLVSAKRCGRSWKRR